MTGDNPLGLETPTEICEQILLERLREIVIEVQRSGLVAPAHGNDQITPDMRRIRGTDLNASQVHYLGGRIDSQRDWYAGKVAWNERSCDRVVCGSSAR